MIADWLPSIREAYDYRTTEGWWIVDTTFSSPEVVEFTAALGPDIWITDIRQYKFGHPHPSDPGNMVMVFKNPIKYLAFRLRWETPEEYQVCRNRYHEVQAAIHLHHNEPDPLYADDVPHVDWTA